MPVQIEARRLSGADIGKTIAPFVGSPGGGLAHKRQGVIVAIHHEPGTVGVEVQHHEGDPLWMDSDSPITITGKPS